MKQLLKFVCIGIAFLGVISVGNAQVLLTFDDLPTRYGVPSHIPNGYGGLDWSNFGVLDGSLPGYVAAVVSPPNVAFGAGNPATISTPSGLFDLDSAYLTAALNVATLNIQVQGFVGATMLYNNTYAVNDSGPTLINFNYDGVDSVTFTSGSIFAMDNLTVTVPEPSSWAIMLLAAVLSGVGANRRESGMAVNKRNI
jgi:hypothetical protein